MTLAAQRENPQGALRLWLGTLSHVSGNRWEGQVSGHTKKVPQQSRPCDSICRTKSVPQAVGRTPV